MFGGLSWKNFSLSRVDGDMMMNIYEKVFGLVQLTSHLGGKKEIKWR